jgi:TRAP-type mannitol/chloroaromatic compound transport system substrate-binding protein
VAWRSCALFRARCSTPKATQEVLGEFAAKSPEFKNIYDWQRFRDDQNLWFRVAEYSLDSYRYSVK